MANLKERNIALVSKDSEGVTTIDYPLTSAEMVEGLEEFVKTHSTPLTLPLPLNNGGTGATTAANARANLGLGNVAVENILPITKGGTGAKSVAEAIKALLGTSAIGSSTKPLYYDGAALKACADSIGGGGIVAALLEQNGYVKFANGLILQWGTITVYANSQKYTFVIPFNETCFYCGGIPWKTANAAYCGVAYTVSKTEFEMYYYYAQGALKVCWIAIGV